MADVPNVADGAAELAPPAQPTVVDNAHRPVDATETTSSPSPGAQEAAIPIENNSLEAPAASRKRRRSVDEDGDHSHADAEYSDVEAGADAKHRGGQEDAAVVDAEPAEQDEETESEVEFEIEAVDEDDDSDQEQKTNDAPQNNGGTRRSLSEPESPMLELLAPTHWNTEQRLDAFGAPPPAAQELAQANRRTPSPMGGQLATLSLKEDEALMWSLLAMESQFADPSVPRAPLWDALAAASGGRFPTGGSVRVRVKWLQDVLHDKNHRDHSKLSSELKRMVRTFRTARQNDEPVRSKRPKKAKALEDPKTAADETAAVAVAVPEDDKDKDSGLTMLDVELEEAFMAVALKHVAELARSERREKVWELIVKDAGGRFEFGSQARNRIMWLLKIFKTPEHRKHERLTPRLKDMLRKFLSFKPFEKLPRSRGKPGHNVTKKSKEKAKSKDDKQRKTPEVAKTGANAKGGSETEWLTIQPEMDELLLKLVIEKRPFEGDRNRKPVIWGEIAQAVTNPRIKDGLSGQGRCRWLVSVFENKIHDEYPNLTPKLRELLPEYIKIYNAHQKKKSSSKNREVDAPPAKPLASEGKSSKPEKSASSKPLAEKEVTRLPREDSVLLREVLTVRPFHKNDETRTQLWKTVADNVAKTLESKKAFPTGESCYERIGVLLKMLHNPAALAQFQLSDNEMQMLQLLDTILKTRWMNLKRLQTDNHRLLTAKIEAFLVRTKPIPRPVKVTVEKSSQLQVPQTPLSPPAAPPTPSQPEPEVNHVEIETPTQTPQSEPPHEEPEPVLEDQAVPEGVEEPLVEELAPVDEQESVHEERVSSPRKPRDKRVAEEEEEAKGEDDQTHVRERSSHKRRRKSHESRHRHDTPATSLVLSEDQIHALQAEIVRLRSLCALSEADRKLFTRKITLLQDEVQSCRDQLTRQSNTLEHERRDHRQELRAMVAMMQTERETHQRETQAMLEAMNKEREDRKNEFVAMMNLVTRSAAAPSAPRE